MNTSHGTGDIHGMVIANTDEDIKGTPNILYNDKCIANLDERFPSHGAAGQEHLARGAAAAVGGAVIAGREGREAGRASRPFSLYWPRAGD